MPYDGLQLGHFRLLHLIGNVDAGKKYLAEDIRTQRQVAIAILQTEVTTLDANPITEAIHSFQHRIQAISMLDHPHILPLFDFSNESIDGTTFTYIVTPFRKEGSLNDWLQQRNNFEMLSPEDVGYFLYQAADALQYLHDQQLVHQNVKPSNFLIRNKNENPDRPDLLLTDFRMGKFATATSSSNESLNSAPDYIAPEQWEDRPVPATDQYALAIMAYQLLTGRLPFQGTAEEIKKQHLNVEPRLPSFLNPRLPMALDIVILRALAKKPEDRFPSVLAFAAAFQQALLTDAIDRDATQPARPFGVTQTVTPISAPLPPPIDTRLLVDTHVTGKGRGIARRMLVWLIVLNIVLTGGNIGLLYTTITNQVARSNTTAQAKTNTTVHAKVNITNTASVLSYPFSNRLLLNDSLSDNNQGNQWEVDNQGIGACAFQGGAYHVSRAGQGRFHTCFALASKFSNFTYEVQMSILKGDCGGIIFRRIGSEFYYYRICIDGSYVFVRYANDVPSSLQNITLKSSTAPAINTGLNAINLLAVVARGSELDLYINRQLIFSMNDNSYTHGQIGFVAKEEMNPTEVVFTNVKVWTL